MLELPAYENYCNLKRRYQMKEVSDDVLPEAMKFVTQELSEFLLILYNNTYLRKERKLIEDMIKNLETRFNS